MHFQRLEQEIVKLKRELAECTRDRLNIKEELSEAHRIKIQLEELHRVEVAKGNIAAAFADRDNAFMEAEKAKEKDEIMSRKLYECPKRLEEVTTDASKAQDLIVDKFYQVKQQSSFDRIHNALEQERDYWKESAFQFQNKIRMFVPTMLNEQENSSLPDSNNLNVEDVHMRIQTLLNIGTRNSAAVEVDTSKVLSQALQEKVRILFPFSLLLDSSVPVVVFYFCAPLTLGST
ncbi:hypothetical protein V2J09_006855 [Rumex salicifolius]